MPIFNSFISLCCILMLSVALPVKDAFAAPPVTPVISYSGSTTICENTVLTLTAVKTGGGSYTGGETFQWQKNGGVVSGATGSSYVVSLSGSYTVTVSNNEGNAVSASVNITVVLNPVVSMTASQTVTCASTENPEWQNVWGYTAAADSLVKAAPSGWYNAGAFAGQKIGRGGFTEVEVGPNTSLDGGFSLSPYFAWGAPNNPDGCMVRTSSGSLLVWDKGVYYGSYGSYSAGDKIKIAIGEDGKINISKNERIFYQSNNIVTSPLYAEFFFYHINMKYKNIKIQREGKWVTFTAAAQNAGTNPVYKWYRNSVIVGPSLASYTTSSLRSGDVLKCELLKSGTCPATVTSNAITISNDVSNTNTRITISESSIPSICTVPENIQWERRVGCSVSNSNGGSITKTAPEGWCCSGNGSAGSLQRIGKGGYVEVTLVSGNAFEGGFGLSTQYTGYLTGNQNSLLFRTSYGTLRIYDKTIDKGTFGSYNTGDKLKVAVGADGKIRCYQNNVLLYTSPNALSLPLVADFQLFTQNISYSNIKILREEKMIDFTASVQNAGEVPTYKWYLNNVLTGANSPAFSISGLNVNDNIKCHVVSYGTCSLEDESNIVAATAGASNTNARVSISGAPINAICGQVENIVWAGVSGCTTSVNSITKTGPEGWNSNGGYATQVIGMEGFVKAAITSDVSKQGGFGLAPTTEAGTPPGTVNNGIYLQFTSGILMIWDNKVQALSWENGYAIGDVFKVAINNQSHAVIFKNDQVIYTSPNTASLPLRANFPIYSNGMSFSQIAVQPSGKFVTFSAVPVYGGDAPTYRWYINDILSANPKPTFIATSLNNTDVVKCEIISYGTCSAMKPSNLSKVVECNLVTETPVMAIASIAYHAMQTARNGIVIDQTETILRLLYKEPYRGSVLTAKIYDYTRQNTTTLQLNVNYGENYLDIPISTMGLISGNIYTMEVFGNKNESQYFKFKYKAAP
jgi:hypothetical protein